MDITDLAQQAYDAIRRANYSLRCMHGIELAEGFFVLYNTQTGQSKTVLYHPESGLVFKEDRYSHEPKRASNRFLGVVKWFDKTLNVRLPEFHLIKIDNTHISAQEYIMGDNCGCGGHWCEHCTDVKTVSRCRDSHPGNWKIIDDDVVLFDFDGIDLD